jgi:broad specificity phosphatase PhoE
MTRWLLARHGETEWNQAGRYQGHLDVPLSDVGRRQSSALGSALANVPIAAAFSSDLSRAAETARLAVQGRDVPHVATPDLRETAYGAWEGLSFREARAKDPDLFEKLLRWEPDLAPPGGESAAQLFTRVSRFAEEASRSHQNDTILAVGHSGSLRMLAAVLLKLPPPISRRFGLENASLSIIESHPLGSSILLWNDTSHYRDAFSALRGR